MTIKLPQDQPAHLWGFDIDLRLCRCGRSKGPSSIQGGLPSSNSTIPLQSPPRTPSYVSYLIRQHNDETFLELKDFN